MNPTTLLTNKSTKLAEFIGIILGDGNISTCSIRKTYQVRITGHSEDDRDYLLNYIRPLATELFNIKFSTYKQPNKKELFLTKGSKNLVYALNYHGLPAGNKVKNNVKIPEWIFENKGHIRSCLRGIIDTDGSLCPKTPKHPYPSIWLRCAIPALRETIFKAFKDLDFNPSKWVYSGAPQCCLGKSEEIKRYYAEIGFKNPNHLNRWKRFAPVV